MVLIAPSVDGAMFGFGVMCYSNGVRRMRVFRRAYHQTSCPHARGIFPITHRADAAASRHARPRLGLAPPAISRGGRAGSGSARSLLGPYSSSGGVRLRPIGEPGSRPRRGRTKDVRRSAFRANTDRGSGLPLRRSVGARGYDGGVRCRGHGLESAERVGAG